MKNAFIVVAVLSFLLPAGCKKTDEKQIPVLHPVAEHPGASPQVRDPNYAGLIEEYRAVLREDPNNLAAIIALGNAYYDSGMWRDAIRFYTHALAHDPQNADVRTDMGTAYRNLGNPERALAEYRLALNAAPGHLDALYNMGIVYAFDIKNYTVAIHIWEDFLRLAPNHPRANDIRTLIASIKKTPAKGTK
ncbi:MAG TPA: tetratricopeptide repeat protein [Nitrospirota bacterium]